jgi:TetR/AcrR family transcriptional regulator, cholesterol catabolism regulator
MAKIKPQNNITKKELVIEKAALLFKTKGYPAASMRELAVELGIEAPSLYNYISSKTELLEIICFKMAAEFSFNLEKVKSMAEGTFFQLEAIIRFHIQKMISHFNEVYVANHEWKHLKEPLFSEFLNFRRDYEKQLVLLVEEGIRKNELRNCNSYITVLTILSAVRGLEFWYGHKKNITIAELENDMVHHLMKGIISDH